MKEKNLFQLLQNSSISAIALHGFVLGYYKVARNKSNRLTYPRLDYLFYVLPIVYNQSALDIFISSNQLYTAVQNERTLIVELQDRAVKMATQTFDGLNLAFSKKVLTYNSNCKSIELMRGFTTKKIPLPLSMSDSQNSIKRIQDSAHKLGAIFAKRNPKNIQVDLNIRF
jgi:hypothetical protein